MYVKTREVLNRVVNEQYGFITADDVPFLLADDRARSRRVILRYHSQPRVVKPLCEVIGNGLIEAAGDDLRDVTFEAAEHQSIKRELANYRPPRIVDL